MKSINLLALIFAYKTFIVIASSNDAGMQLDPSSTSTAVYYTTSSVAENDTNISEQRFDIDMTDGNTTSTTSTKTTTKQDTKKCNNDGTCSLFENASNCPSDCNDLELSTLPPNLQDTTTTNDSSVGLMFTIKSTSRNIVVTSMDIYTKQSSVQTHQIVEIYTKPASYTGYETFNERDWELVYNNTNVANINLPGEEDVSQLTLSGLVIPVANGTEQSFYIYTPNLIRSTNGRRGEEEEEDKVVLTSNDMLEIYEGIGLKQKYINVYDEDVISSRAFVGTIR